jgi:hypothetical protein
LKKVIGIQAWWCTPVIPALDRLRRVDREFEAILGLRGKKNVIGSLSVAWMSEELDFNSYSIERGPVTLGKCPCVSRLF